MSQNENVVTLNSKFQLFIGPFAPVFTTAKKDLAEKVATGEVSPSVVKSNPGTPKMRIPSFTAPGKKVSSTNESDNRYEFFGKFSHVPAYDYFNQAFKKAYCAHS